MARHVDMKKYYLFVCLWAGETPYVLIDDAPSHAECITLSIEWEQRAVAWQRRNPNVAKQRSASMMCSPTPVLINAYTDLRTVDL